MYDMYSVVRRSQARVPKKSGGEKKKDDYCACKKKTLGLFDLVRVRTHLGCFFLGCRLSYPNTTYTHKSGASRLCGAVRPPPTRAIYAMEASRVASDVAPSLPDRLQVRVSGLLVCSPLGVRSLACPMFVVCSISRFLLVVGSMCYPGWVACATPPTRPCDPSSPRLPLLQPLVFFARTGNVCWWSDLDGSSPQQRSMNARCPWGWTPAKRTAKPAWSTSDIW